jgi:hypothetical protein
MVQGLREKAAMRNVLVHMISKVFSGVSDAVFGTPGDNHGHTTFEDLRDANGIVHVPRH